jgi:hypothetical protein
VSECPLKSPATEGESPVIVSPLLSLKRRNHFLNSSWKKNKNMIMDNDGT